MYSAGSQDKTSHLVIRILYTIDKSYKPSNQTEEANLLPNHTPIHNHRKFHLNFLWSTENRTLPLIHRKQNTYYETDVLAIRIRIRLKKRRKSQRPETASIGSSTKATITSAGTQKLQLKSQNQRKQLSKHHKIERPLYLFNLVGAGRHIY